MTDSQGSLLDQVRSGTNRQLQLLAASGLLPIPPQELIPVQVELARGRDAEISQRATETLLGLDLHIAGPFLEHQAYESALSFFAAESSHPGIIEVIIRRRDVPRQVLKDLARRVPPDLQEVLILRQDAILDEPTILEALEDNPQLSSYTQRRIAEYRQHLLPRERGGTAGPTPAVVEEMEEEDLAITLSAIKRAMPVEGEVEDQTGLSEGQIRMLPVPARLKLSRGAGRVLRGFLLRDSNTQVALSALLSNNLPEQEVEQIANSRAVAEEILEAISRKREWVSRYGVAKALVKNPKTPLPISMKLINRMAVRDLRDLGRDKNIPDAVRSTALRLYRIKQQ
ncbi:MAG TPA: hypothetical protein VH988_07325 [Thermoanaerobaculia bacterium]|nr:hypothetical protein [Thermoanaerobaculia bacterium]